MPIYEYECSACGERFEKMQPVTAEPLTECVKCGKGPIRRIFHPVGVIFKGSGWYATDNRKSNSSSAMDSKSDSSGSAGDSSDSKSDSSGSAGASAAPATKTEKAADPD
jgi:putative FmdB family regulatory protein